MLYLNHETEVLVDLRQEQNAGEEEGRGDREEQLGQEERFLLIHIIHDTRYTRNGMFAEVVDGKQSDGLL